ncbi:MAG: hypothetical protein H0U74_17075, partial [Bradymonadaceae bacterium]|nr:hypothetical protein [Lujinxingiaceae bacterium]
LTTSREAEAVLKKLAIRGFSRSTLERKGHAVGERLEQERDVMESALIEVFEIPKEAVSVSVSIDRVTLPMEKAVKRAKSTSKKKAAKRPIEVIYKEAYVG